jgi:hypothetical protein
MFLLLVVGVRGVLHQRNGLVWWLGAQGLLQDGLKFATDHDCRKSLRGLLLQSCSMS